MGRGQAHGTKWNIPPMPRPGKPREMAARGAELVAERLKADLRSNQPPRVAGLAQWLASRIEVKDNAVTWPDTEAIQRLKLTDIEQAWMDDALRKVLSEVTDGH